MGRGRDSRIPGNSLADRLRHKEQSDNRRKELIASLTRKRSSISVAELTPDRIQRDGAKMRAQLTETPFYYIGEELCFAPSTTYLELVDAAVRAMNSGKPEVVLCWPAQQASISAVVALAALADAASTPQRKVTTRTSTDVIADEPLGLRAVLFPYARTTHIGAREIQIDRKTLTNLHLKHLLRTLKEGESALKDYHTVLTRVGTMTGKARDGRIYPEFLHPVLDEIVPHGSARNGCATDGHLLWRTKSKTDLGALRRSGLADDARAARYFLYEIGAADPFERELRAQKVAPHIFILDASRTAQGRLGRDWLQLVRKSLETLKRLYPETAVLIVTDDPWAFDAARFELFAEPQTQKRISRLPIPGKTIFSLSTSVLARLGEDAAGTWSGASTILVDGFAGQLQASITDMRAIAQKLRSRGNPTGADAAGAVIGKLRRCASLPGTLAELSEFLESQAGDQVAADNMAAYRVSADFSQLEDPRTGAMQIAQSELNEARSRVDAVATAVESATPMATLLEELIEPCLRSSSKTLVVFRTEMISDFAIDRLSRKYPRLHDKLERDIIRFTSRHGFPDVAALLHNIRNQFKRLILVGPTRYGAAELLAQPWLPDEVTILGDSDTLRFAARDAARLASQINLPEPKRRLQRFADVAGVRVGQLGSHAIQLDQIVAPSADVEFPYGSIIDLTGSGRSDRSVIEIQMQSGQTIIARPGTGLVSRDNSRSVPRFVEVAASDVGEGDEICVISPGFVEKVRSILNITAAAAEEIRDYHDLVRERFAALAGDNETSRLRTLCSLMGEPPERLATARYWIDLDEELEKPIYEVVPHAPQDFPTFMRFTTTLGMSTKLAERFWAWAVIVQRSTRIRAGAAFHDAYKGILTDQHGALAANRGREADLRALRSAANDYVSVVASIRKVGGR